MLFTRKLTYNKALDMYSITFPRTFVDGFLKETDVKAEDIFVEINGNDIRQFHAKITNKDGNPIEVAIKNE